MAELLITTETGVFHTACRFTWGAKVEWRGFKPKTHLAPIDQGYVDHSNRGGMINHSASFTISDAILYSTLNLISDKYDDSRYVLFIRDCVSFSADVGRSAGLAVPTRNLSPIGFLLWIETFNKTNYTN